MLAPQIRNLSNEYSYPHLLAIALVLVTSLVRFTISSYTGLKHKRLEQIKLLNAQALEELCHKVDAITTRVEFLEGVLDREAPGWRQK